MNKQCGLVCCYKMYNYGGTLQSFALQLYLKKNHVQNEMINYTSGMGAWKLYRWIKIVDWNRIYRKLIVRRKAETLSEDKLNLVNCVQRKFQEFVTKNYDVSKKLNGYHNLKTYAKKYRNVIVGSDQLWSPSNIYSEYYSLAFVSKGSKKISYSTSIGKDTIEKRFYNRYRSMLKDFSNISVREASAQKFLGKLTNRNIELVMDPVFLIEREGWEIYEVKPQNFQLENYIFAYIVGEPSRYEKIVKKIKEKLNLTIINIPNIRYDQIEKEVPWGGENIEGVGPGEFLYLLNHAAFVITDSFHGTAFSTIFMKQFISVYRYDEDDKQSSTNGRIYSTLERLGLTKRIYQKDSIVEDMIDNQINYDIVNVKKAEQMEHSKKYLKECLGL